MTKKTCVCTPSGTGEMRYQLEPTTSGNLTIASSWQVTLRSQITPQTPRLNRPVGASSVGTAAAASASSAAVVVVVAAFAAVSRTAVQRHAQPKQQHRMELHACNIQRLQDKISCLTNAKTKRTCGVCHGPGNRPESRVSSSPEGSYGVLWRRAPWRYPREGCTTYEHLR